MKLYAKVCRPLKKKRCLVARLLSPHPCLPPRWLMMLVPEVHGFLTLQAGQTKALLNAISIVVNLHRSIYIMSSSMRNGQNVHNDNSNISIIISKSLWTMADTVAQTGPYNLELQHTSPTLVVPPYFLQLPHHEPSLLPSRQLGIEAGGASTGLILKLNT